MNSKGSIVVGAMSALIANVFLGVSSVFWRSIGSINIIALVGYRVFLSCLIVLIVVLLRRRLKILVGFLSVRVVMIHCVAAILIAINWLVFIGASVNGQVLESGIGYLIAPLVSVCFGVIFSKESISFFVVLALGVVSASILALVMFTETLSAVVYLSIGLSWGSYMYLKNISTLDALDGLLVESAVLSVLCIIWLCQVSGAMEIPRDFDLTHRLLLLSCGFVSLLPLALLSFSAKRLDVMTMGVFQYLLPLTLFAMSVGFYKQSFSVLLVMVLVVISAAVLVVSINIQLARSD